MVKGSNPFGPAFNGDLMVSRQDKEKIKNTLELFDILINDTSIPKNIRKTIIDAKTRLSKEDDEINVRASSAIYLLDSVSEDINMPMHARSQIWNILSILESIKK